MTELFRSANLLVRRVGERGGTTFVTFSPYTNERTLDREGFAEGFLAREGFDAVHVLTIDNRWYQYPEMPDALAAIRESVASADRVITYGSSMGAYAALRFAAAVGAEDAIAISPQYSVDPRVVPNERRWQAEVARIAFDEPTHAPTRRQYLFFDPRMPEDAEHVRLFATHGRTVAIPLPFAGHPVAPLLAETGALQEAVRAVAAGYFDPDSVRRHVRRNRHRSQHQHFILALRAGKRRPALAAALLRRAAAIEPEAHITSALGVALDRLGERTEARQWHEAAVARTPAFARGRIAYALHLEATGDRPAALAQLAAARLGQSSSVQILIRTHQARMRLRGMGLGLLDAAAGRVIERIRASPRYPAILRRLGRNVD